MTAYYEPAAVVDYAEQSFIQAGNTIVVAAIGLVVCLAAVLALVEPAQRRPEGFGCAPARGGDAPGPGAQAQGQRHALAAHQRV